MHQVIKFSRCTGSGLERTFPILSLEPLKTLRGHGTPIAHGIAFKSVPLDSQINHLKWHFGFSKMITLRFLVYIFGYSNVSLGQKNGLEEISKGLVITA